MESHETVSAAVRNAVMADKDAMVTRSVVVYEYMSTEGERRVSVQASEDARWWDVIGLVGMADAYARSRVANDTTVAD